MGGIKIYIGGIVDRVYLLIVCGRDRKRKEVRIIVEFWFRDLYGR